MCLSDDLERHFACGYSLKPFGNRARRRRGQGKYLYLSDGNRFLFDLESDQHENENLLEQHPELGDELHAELSGWCDELQPAGLPTTPLNGEELAWSAHYLKVQR